MDEKNAAYFRKLLFDRLESMPNRVETEEDLFHQGTERLLINFALNRIKTGDYWSCVKCGEDIAEKRLTADPITLLCRECMPHRERHSTFKNGP